MHLFLPGWLWWRWKMMNCWYIYTHFFGLTKISAYKEFTASGGNVWTWPEQPYTKCISMVYCRCAAKSEQCQSFVWSQAKPRNNIIITNTQGHFTIYEHIWICDDENRPVSSLPWQNPATEIRKISALIRCNYLGMINIWMSFCIRIYTV